MAYEKTSSVQATGVCPQVLTAAFLQILRCLFSDKNAISQHDLKSRLWSPDPKQSQILIEPSRIWTTEKIQARPAIFVERGEWDFEKMSVGDVLHGVPDAVGFVEADVLFSLRGAHSITCVGSNNLEAELLATEVLHHFLAFTPIIRDQLCLLNFLVQKLLPAAKLDEAKETSYVKLAFAYTANQSFKLIRQTPEWARTGLNLSLT